MPPVIAGGVGVQPKAGTTATVTFTDARGGTPTAYASQDGLGTIGLPATFSTLTKFWFAAPGTYTMSAKVNGVENANGEGGTLAVRVGDGGLSVVDVKPLAGSGSYFAPASKPTVTGAKGSNAALGSLLTALANLGLITDNTTT